FSQKYLPLSDIGMGWVVLSLIGFIIGFIIYKFKHRKIPQA
ncbi:branched-chain amino acid transport system II carrier protein, partial [Staphylococcus aureus]